jgi:hypothetical protein
METPMKTVLLAAGAAAVALTAGQALAHGKHHKDAMASIAGPRQPIPYAELDPYLKASPAQRAKKDWWAGTGYASNSAASTGANASATTSSETTPGASSSSAAPAPNPANPTPPTNSNSATPPK